MKKKIFFIAVAILFTGILFTNTGYAKAVTKKITAVFGSYVIKVNGTTQKTESLANGSKVYIPIDEVSKLTGSKVSKSGSTYNIVPVKKEDGITRSNVEEIKIMVRFLDSYDRLEDYQRSIGFIWDFLDYSYYDIRDNDSVEELNDTINKYNKYLEQLEKINVNFEGLVKQAALKKYNTKIEEAFFNGIYNDYQNSLENLSKSLDELKLYYQTGNEIHIKNYRDYADNALKYSYDAEDKAFNRYLYFTDIINKK